jgi:hypothetical protein
VKASLYVFPSVNYKKPSPGAEFAPVMRISEGRLVDHLFNLQQSKGKNYISKIKGVKNMTKVII